MVAPGGAVSYKAACLNGSAFTANYYEGTACAGAVIHAQPVAWAAGCTGDASGRATLAATCVAGSYPTPARAINTFFYGEPAACPLAPGAHFAGVVSVPLGCLTPPASPTSYLYGCDARNVTATPFTGAGCKGKPLGPPVALGPLGCADKTDGAAFTACGGAPAPPAPAQGLRAAAPAPAAAQGAVGSAVAAGLTRANELARAAAAAHTRTA